MDTYPPFTPQWADTVSLSATAVSGRVALSGEQIDQVEISNDGPDAVFVTFGNSSIDATVPNGATGGSYPVLAGQSKMVSPAANSTHAAAICASGKTATVWLSPGRGQ
jgi:hypothetical protein